MDTHGYHLVDLSLLQWISTSFGYHCLCLLGDEFHLLDYEGCAGIGIFFGQLGRFCFILSHANPFQTVSSIFITILQVQQFANVFHDFKLPDCVKGQTAKKDLCSNNNPSAGGKLLPTFKREEYFSHNLPRVLLSLIPVRHSIHPIDNLLYR